MALKKVFEAMCSALTARTGLMVLMDPQPVHSGQPHLRLTYQGSEGIGKDVSGLKWQLSLTGAGDGPEVYLVAVVRASLALEAMYDPCKGRQYIDLDVDGESVRMSMVTGLQATGGFAQNEMKIVETGQWSYLWTEPKWLAVSIPDRLWEEEDT